MELWAVCWPVPLPQSAYASVSRHCLPLSDLPTDLHILSGYVLIQWSLEYTFSESDFS